MIVDKILNMVRLTGPIWAYRVLLIISQLFIIPYLITHLGVDEYGLYVVLGVAGNFLSILDLGLGSGLQNRFAQCAENRVELTMIRDFAFTALLSASVLILPVAVFFAQYILVFFHIPAFQILGLTPSYSIALFAIISSLVSISSAYSKILIGLGQINRSFLFQSINLIFSTLVVFISVDFFKSKSGLDVFLLRGAALFLSGLVMSYIALFGARFKMTTLSQNFDTLRLCLKFMVFGLISVLVSGLPYKFISATLSPVEIVKYNILERFYGVAQQFAQSPLGALAPKFTISILRRNLDEMQRYLYDYLAFAIPVIGACLLFLLIFNTYVSSYLGAGQLNDIDHMAILSFGLLSVTNLWIAFFSTALQSGGKLNVLIVFSPVHVALLIALGGYLVSFFGLIGAILSLIIANVLMPCLILPHTLRNVFKPIKS